MNKFAITFRRTCKLFSKSIPSGLGEILEMHSAVFKDIHVDSSPLPLNRTSLYLSKGRFWSPLQTVTDYTDLLSRMSYWN